jgi:5-methylcytosine-specific restriction endonuclease McrA
MLCTRIAEVVTVEDGTYCSYDIESWSELSDLKVQFDELAETDDVVRTPSMSFLVPRILRTIVYNKIPDRTVKLNRKNLFARDRNSCFVPGTKILMADGDLTDIDSIRIGDAVLDAYGKVQRVEAVYSERVKEKILRIRWRGNGDAILCTKEHKLLACDYDGYFDDDGVRADSLSLSNNLFMINAKSFGSLVDNDDLHIDTQGLKNVKEAGKEKLSCYMDGNTIKRNIKYSFDLGRFVGFFLAEGCEINGQITFSFHVDESNYARDVMSLFASIFGLEAREEVVEEHHQRSIIKGSKILGKFLRRICYKDGDKRLVNKNYPLEFLRGVLCGVALGDGNFNKDLKRLTVMMARENLIRDLYLISILCNVYPTLSKTSIRKDGRIYKSLIYQAQEYNKMMDLCGLEYERYMNANFNAKVDRNITANSIIGKISSIREIDYDGLVYDLQVSGSHTYIANFSAVHNCQYCGKKFKTSELNLDHVIPRSRGGREEWDNLVCACVKCNNRKANRTPQEAGMKLVKKPVRPRFSPVMKVKVGDRRYQSWSTFVSDAYWNVELTED